MPHHLGESIVLDELRTSQSTLASIPQYRSPDNIVLVAICDKQFLVAEPKLSKKGRQLFSIQGTSLSDQKVYGGAALIGGFSFRISSEIQAFQPTGAGLASL